MLMDAGVNWVNDQCILVVYLGPVWYARYDIWAHSKNLMFFPEFDDIVFERQLLG